MAKQKKLRENTNSNKTTDRKNINKAKPKKAGTVIAVILALVLIASSAAAVTYLINRGKRAMSDYSGSSVEATMPEEATVHKVPTLKKVKAILTVQYTYGKTKDMRYSRVALRTQRNTPQA